MNRALLSLAIVIATFFAPAARSGAQGADDPQRIVDESQRRATTASERYEGLLESFTKDGKTSEKRWIFERLGAHGLSKSVIRFTAPAEVRGVALLIVNHPDRPSDQWMWTPAIQRDRRIALQDRSTRFFGTDFTFEDLEEREAAQYTHQLLGEEPIDGAAAWKIQARPKPWRSSQYTNTIVWVRKDNYAMVRIDSFVEGKLVRRLQSSELQQVQGIWTAHKNVMTDYSRGTVTQLSLEKVDYNLPLKEGDFTLQALRRRS